MIIHLSCPHYGQRSLILGSSPSTPHQQHQKDTGPAASNTTPRPSGIYNNVSPISETGKKLFQVCQITRF